MSDAPTAQAEGLSAALRAVPRSGWHVATVAATHRETPNASRIELDVPGWPGNAAGQHLDVRLTADDGYQATRSYSIASSGPSTRVVLAVDKLPDGEVSPFLVDELQVGDQLEVHGPLGAFFVWRPAAETGDDRPVQLIAGGSGVVPLYAMAQAHADADGPALRRGRVEVRVRHLAAAGDVLDGGQHGEGALRLARGRLAGLPQLVVDVRAPGAHELPDAPPGLLGDLGPQELHEPRAEGLSGALPPTRTLLQA